MKKPWVRFISLVGLLGLLGIFTSNIGFLGFFGFFGFLSYGRVANDERLEANVNRAARNAFVVSMTIFVISIVLVALTKDLKIYAYTHAVNFALAVVTFSVSLRLYDR